MNVWAIFKSFIFLQTYKDQINSKIELMEF